MSAEENIDKKEATESVSGESKANAENEIKEEVSLECKYNELNDKYLRLYSEFDNYKKRATKERIDLIKSAGEEIFKSILPFIDDFERAIKANAEATDIKAVNEGIYLVYHKVQSICKAKGLEEMNPIGLAFDPEIHDAITKIPAPSEDLKEKIVDVVEKGYSLNRKVIRFAKVVVGI